MHTLGTLFEDTQYKNTLKEGNVSALAKIFISNCAKEVNGSSGGNPLAEPEMKEDGYEKLNKEAGEFAEFVCLCVQDERLSGCLKISSYHHQRKSRD